MNTDQVKTYLAALASSLTIGVLIPILILLLITAMIWLLISRAQRDPGFDIANTLRDEAGKESSVRVLTFGAFAVTSWGYAVSAFALPQYFSDVTLYYLAFWSGSPVALELAKKWDGRLPWSPKT
jgi:hypothetical protein